MRSYYDSTLSSYDTFHYVLNAQGDVVQLNYQGRQDKVYAQYTYDAWGNVLTQSGSLADVNPLRYRGYYCDTETGFYYLQSRYYDPVVKRFLNADSLASTGQGFTGFNMFAYCMNSPVTRIDEAGTDSIWWRLIEDYCFGFIHLAVQMHIVLHNPGIGMEKAVYNNEGKKCGRADIFDLEAGKVWELKTVRTGAEAAALQVEKYCGKHLKDSDIKLTKGMRVKSEFVCKVL